MIAHHFLLISFVSIDNQIKVLLLCNTKSYQQSAIFHSVSRALTQMPRGNSLSRLCHDPQEMPRTYTLRTAISYVEVIQI